jgi:HD-like signal output (HDOD) protein
MKNWINRLLTGSGDSAPAPGASSARDGANRPAAQVADPGVEIDARYYRWLTSSACYNAPPEIESQILDDIQTLAASPGDAADLVPRVPEVIPQLLRSLDGDGASAAELSRLVMQDVVLTAEVLREANSAYYRSIDPVKSVEAAILMLGQTGLRMLLARLAFRPIIQMQADGFARRVAPHLWSQAEKCAFAASLLAPGLPAGVFEAYLAGLMQNVGLVVAFRLADRVCQDGKVPRSDEFGVKLLSVSRKLSAGIAAHWAFPQDVVDAIAHAGDPGDLKLAQALSKGDRIAKLRLLIDAFALTPDDDLVTNGLDPFQRRCLGKVSNLDG